MKDSVTVFNEMIERIKKLSFEDLNRAVQKTNKEFELEEMLNDLISSVQSYIEIASSFEEEYKYNTFDIKNWTKNESNKTYMDSNTEGMEDAA